MKPSDVTLYDFATARVVYVWPVSILYIAGQITDNRIACILQTHRRVVRPFLGCDGILKSCFFESRVPVFNSLNKVFTPLFRCGWVEIVDNLFLIRKLLIRVSEISHAFVKGTACHRLFGKNDE